MYELAVLEATFLIEGDPDERKATPATGGANVSDAYGARLSSLLGALGGRYQDCLFGSHTYESDSEASMAVVDAMVARHFTDAEIWQTLEGSLLYARRVEKKGERHARDLYTAEIEKAMGSVQPFDRDPADTGRGTGAYGEPLAQDLPQIVITGEHLHRLSESAWAALSAANDPPRLFQIAGAIARVQEDDEGRHFIKPMSAAAIKGTLDRSAFWMRQTKAGLVPARPPKDVIEDMMALEKPLPPIRGIVGTPVFTKTGELATETGYQVRTHLFYVPVGRPVPSVPAVPTEADVSRAKALLLDEWLVDFPFVDAASRASVIAGALTPPAREMIAGPAPMLGLDAPTAGTGKGLLGETIGIVNTGAQPAVMNDARQEDEIRKRITSVLLGGPPVVLIDNIKRRVTSGSLAALLTATVWGDRMLGGNEMARLPNRSLWMATGNNLDFDFEIARRTIWSRLDAKLDRPSERTTFRHHPLSAWVQENRHELVWALLVLIQNWIAQGRPKWNGVPLGSFESWCDVIGGTLVAAGIEGFLANRYDLYRQADTETEEWRTFVAAWWEEFSSKPVKAAELLAMTQREQLLLTLFATARDVATERSLVTRLGAALMARRDRRYGGFFMRHLGRDGHAKGAVYRLEPVPEDPPAEPRSTGEAGGSAEVPHGSRPISDTNAEPAERAEPKTHEDAQRDHDARERVSGASYGGPPTKHRKLHAKAEEQNSGSSPIEVPQVPHVPQTDSETTSEHAEPVTEAGAEVPQKVPQPALPDKVPQGDTQDRDGLFGESCSCGEVAVQYDAEGMAYCEDHRPGKPRRKKAPGERDEAGQQGWFEEISG